jgi:UMP-CMP kinase
MAPKGFCPFSLFLFVSSAVASVRYLQQQRSKTKGGSDDEEQPFRVVFVLGGPGAGKGTQCQLLSTNLGWCHLSAGDLLRAERTKANSPLADIINSNINAGKIVPSDITVRLLKNAMYEHRVQTGQTKFLIDGFPRSEGNVSSWNIIFNNNKEENAIGANIECVLFFECPEEVLISRLLERSKTSGRVDDSSIDIIRQRFATYHEESMPIINMYEKYGIVRKIIADRSIEQVYMEVESILKE